MFIWFQNVKGVNGIVDYRFHIDSFHFNINHINEYPLIFYLMELYYEKSNSSRDW